MWRFGSRDGTRLRGLTVADTVVLLVVLVLFVGVLMPAFSRVRAEAVNDTCAAHLSGLGKAMLLYANDYDDVFPRAGGRDPNWRPVQWAALSRSQAYDITSPDGTGGNATISSCFYLLVKYAEVIPRIFICPEDPCVAEFTLAGEADCPAGLTKLFDAWDFGTAPQTHCSYAYQTPWGSYVLTTSREPNLPVAADRNPYIASPGQKVAKTFTSPSDPTVVFAGRIGGAASEMYGNSTVHKGEGQNVLFLDAHVAFETRPFCGLEDDNIYTPTRYTDKGDSLGVLVPNPPTRATVVPGNPKDSILVHDPLAFAPVR